MNGFIARVSGPALASIVLLTSVGTANAGGLRQELINYSNPNYSGEYTFRHCKAITKQPFDLKAPKRKVLIIGDSQACDFYNGIVETGSLNNYQVSLRYIPYSC
ncbi:hypothetical protein [Leucothrix pacifica]|uniref:SGNH domain-containing protein n=1 Tax=Leucothrix pacifica TaxID=1247513 RepID=A0A317CKS1_9GAMM|nr:hypothetical protein [Leucothrix pacifica]PWQ98043.1 hypothetical protein DKW60_08870 [Leucothrix pacifica]